MRSNEFTSQTNRLNESAKRLTDRMYSIANGAIWAAIPKWVYAVAGALLLIAVGLGIWCYNLDKENEHLQKVEWLYRYERVSYDAKGIHNMMLHKEAMMVGIRQEQDSIKAFYYNFCNFMVENCSATPDQLMLDWNSVGACIHYFGEDRTIQFRLWERSEGHRVIPDMMLIIIRISFRGTQKTIRAKMKAFIQWLKQTAKTHDFVHFADEDCQPLAIAQVSGCRIACIRL